MPKKINDFFKFIKSKYKFGTDHKNIEEDQEEIQLKKIYKRNFQPIRQIVLWGIDEYNNPGFLILYGKHYFLHQRYNMNTLKDDVKYENYIIFKGSNGHFPAFEALKINDDYDYSTRKYNTHMYYKKDYKLRYEQKYFVKEFKSFDKNINISFPYFVDVPYKNYVESLRSKNISFENFRIVDDPNEILQLGTDLFKYYEIICEMFSNPNIYIRKKCLNELINSDKLSQITDFILKYGSVEIISGLFLEFAKTKNDILINEAKKILSSYDNWLSESYFKGLKRCINLYLNCFDENIKNERIDFIKNNIDDIDLKLVKVNFQDVTKNNLNGSNYLLYYNRSYLNEYAQIYSNQERKFVKIRRSDLYQKNYYCDGAILNIINFKNTIQESEIFGLHKNLGKIAYFLDAPRLTFHFKANNNYNGLLYFRRYIRRIIDSYSKNDELKFIESLKILFKNYKNDDYVSGIKNNFQENYFIKHYLYYDFKEKMPTDWSLRYEWIRNDQLLKLNGRYDYKKEIWDNHTEDIIDIISESEVIVILKAFYFILKDSQNLNNIVENLSIEKIVYLVICPFEPISKLFVDILNRRLEKEINFNIETMIALINSPCKEINIIAMEYFKRTKGKFSSDTLVDFLFIKNLNDWLELIEQNIYLLTSEEYIFFIKNIFNSSDKFLQNNFSPSKELIDILEKSINKLNDCSISDKTNFITIIVEDLKNNNEMPTFIFDLIEKLVFGISFDELKLILKSIEIENNQNLMLQKNNLIFSLLKSIKTNKIPQNNIIVEVIDTGTSKMIKKLVELISENINQLDLRFTTILLMLESEIVELNSKAKIVFNNLQISEQKKLLSIIIDSPEIKAYSFGIKKLHEIYEKPNELIPKEFVLQMLEHSSKEVKSYISNKLIGIIDNLGNGDKELFMYYVKTLLFIPNKLSKGKNNIYKILPIFVSKYKEEQNEIEEMLLNLGCSNIISDSEKALVALAKIKKEVI